MKACTRPEVYSSPCMLGEQSPDMIRQSNAPAEAVLLYSLSRIFGVHPDSHKAGFLTDITHLFQQRRVDAETSLESHGTPWRNVYLIQHGILRLFREAPTGKVAIHHFYSEGDLVWPLFGRTRTVRNTLCLTATTPATLWIADFATFRAAIQACDEGLWSRFALVMTEELAELTSVREFRKHTMQASERYALLLEEYPELVRRVPDNQLASWLGVAPATFSRLKHRAGQNKRQRA